MEVFNGEFKYQPRDYRYFAAFYLLLRIINIFLLLNTNGIVYFPIGAVFFATSSLLIAFLKPYKKSFHNIVDTVLIFVVAVTFLGPLFHQTFWTVLNSTIMYAMVSVVFVTVVCFYCCFCTCIYIYIYVNNEVDSLC